MTILGEEIQAEGTVSAETLRWEDVRETAEVWLGLCEQEGKCMKCDLTTTQVSVVLGLKAKSLESIMKSFRKEDKVIQFTFQLVILAAVWSEIIWDAKQEAKKKKIQERIERSWNSWGWLEARWEMVIGSNSSNILKLELVSFAEGWGVLKSKLRHI